MVIRYTQPIYLNRLGSDEQIKLLIDHGIIAHCHVTLLFVQADQVTQMNDHIAGFQCCLLCVLCPDEQLKIFTISFSSA